MTKPETPAVSVQDVSLNYGGPPVLDNISFQLPPGAVVGLVGRNGAGKSTLLRCLLSLSLPQSGSVQVLGDAAHELSDTTRERIGYVPQLPDLVEWMTVWQHVSYIGSFYSRWSEKTARDLCIRFELPLDLKVKSLSVGDKQKLSIILALAHDPELVLMDEPVASLDPMMRREFMRALFDTEQTRTILISSHLLSDLERVVSYVAFMREGRLQLMGGWDELSENLRIVSLPEALPKQAGLVAERLDQDGWRAIVDKRVSGMQRHAESGAVPTLDDLFVELNT
jgi:ABC-2 type transport system ATP-binding protein